MPPVHCSSLPGASWRLSLFARVPQLLALFTGSDVAVKSTRECSRDCCLHCGSTRLANVSEWKSFIVLFGGGDGGGSAIDYYGFSQEGEHTAVSNLQRLGAAGEKGWMGFSFGNNGNCFISACGCLFPSHSSSLPRFGSSVCV